MPIKRASRRVLRTLVCAIGLGIVAWRGATLVQTLPSVWDQRDYYDDNSNLIGQHWVNCNEPVHDPWWGRSPAITMKRRAAAQPTRPMVTSSANGATGFRGRL